MSLKIKTPLILLFFILIYIAAHMSIERYIILPGFLSLEITEAEKNARRPVQAIQREIHHLASFIHDWSAWDETYDFIVTKSPDYVESNIVYSTFQDNTLNMIYLCDTEGQVAWKGSYDLESGKKIAIPEMPEFFNKNHPLTSFKTKNIELKDIMISGIYMTSEFPLLVASRPILTNGNKGPIRGSVIMGRFLTPGIIKNLIKQTEVQFEVIPVHHFSDKSIIKKIEKNNNSYIKIIDDKSLNAFALIRDISGKPALLIKSVMGRKIAKKGFETMRYALFSTLLFGLFMLFGIIITLHIIIVKPVSLITNHTLSVGNTGNLYSRLNLQRKDEIGAFANKLDKMLEQLADARNRLLEQSYYSGLAGMASDILHNTGNILTPVSLKINNLFEKLNVIPFENMNKAVAELENGKVKKDRAEALSQYLSLTFHELESTVRETEHELSYISGQMSEIESLLIELDDHSRSGKMDEFLSVIELCTHALSLMPLDLKNKIKTLFQPGIKKLPPIFAERLVIVQIITTIMNHSAIKAVKSNKNDPVLIIDGQTETSENGTMIHLTITDNGSGYTPEELKNIFARDFSETLEPKTITGLHWCTNTISAMNGRCYAENNDKNEGSVFHIVLPIGADNA